MNTIANSFSAYSPLDSSLKQIRPLIIHAGPRAAPLSCSLAPVSLGVESLREYEAVSYCWGDIQDKENITLNGQVFTTTKSGGAALRAIRRQNQDRVVWLDAICINQQDTAERGAQVSIMKQIYEAAKRTLIFLGEDDGTFESAAGLILTLVRQMAYQTDRWEHENTQARRDIPKKYNWDSVYDKTTVCTHGVPPFDDHGITWRNSLIDHGSLDCGSCKRLLCLTHRLRFVDHWSSTGCT